tara:strand:+ start:14914 stop:15111 length:198 start_codon:yes stop_codon:yes gene_type:complete
MQALIQVAYLLVVIAAIVLGHKKGGDKYAFIALFGGVALGWIIFGLGDADCFIDWDGRSNPASCD